MWRDTNQAVNTEITEGLESRNRERLGWRGGFLYVLGTDSLVAINILLTTCDFSNVK